MTNSRVMLYNNQQPRLGMSEFADTREGKLIEAVIKTAMLDQGRMIRRIREFDHRTQKETFREAHQDLEDLAEFFEKKEPIAINLAWACHALYENGEEMRRYICKLWHAARYVEGH